MTISMKTILIVMCAMLFIAPCIKAEDLKKEPDEVPIVIIKGNEGKPRTPDVSTGIDAYYQNGVIYLQFGWELGCMDVSVTNHATGEQWLDAVCSDSGAEAVYISTSAGNYTTELTTDDGTTYSVTFTL